MLFDFFFSSRRRHTRYWRDWSSDVCSSDLHPLNCIESARYLYSRRCNSRDAAGPSGARRAGREAVDGWHPATCYKHGGQGIIAAVATRSSHARREHYSRDRTTDRLQPVGHYRGGSTWNFPVAGTASASSPPTCLISAGAGGVFHLLGGTCPANH